MQIDTAFWAAVPKQGMFFTIADLLRVVRSVTG